MRLSRPGPRLLANPPQRPNSAALALMSISKSISVMLPSFIGLVVVVLLRSKCIKVGVWYDPTSLGNLIAAVIDHSKVLFRRVDGLVRTDCLQEPRLQTSYCHFCAPQSLHAHGRSSEWRVVFFQEQQVDIGSQEIVHEMKRRVSQRVAYG